MGGARQVCRWGMGWGRESGKRVEREREERKDGQRGQRLGTVRHGMEIRGGQAKRWTTRRQIWAWIDKRTENRDKWTRKKRLRRPVKGQRLG